MFETIKDRWHARFARKLLDQAKREVGGDQPKLTVRLTVAWLLAVLVLLTPVIVGGAGVVLIAKTFPGVWPGIVGLILIGFAYVIMPPRSRNMDKTYRRSDLPQLFNLMDEIADHLGCEPIDGLHFIDEFNAYITRYRPLFSKRQEWIVGIGFPLWVAFTPAQRIAVLAHELGHKVNQDPMRSGMFFQANVVLRSWYDTFDPEYHGEYEGSVVQAIMRKTISGYSHVLSWFTFFESQRAEYRADAFAARVAGRTALCDMLALFTRTDLIEPSIIDLYPYRDDQNGRIFDHMAQAVRDVDPETAHRLLAEAAEEKHVIDTSHPPTMMRIEFVKALPEVCDAGAMDPALIDWDAIDAELQGIKDQLGGDLMADLYELQVNR